MHSLLNVGTEYKLKQRVIFGLELKQIFTGKSQKILNGKFVFWVTTLKQ